MSQALRQFDCMMLISQPQGPTYYSRLPSTPSFPVLLSATMVERTNANMLFANFNQDFSCVSVGTRRGYNITNCDPFGRVYTMSKCDVECTRSYAELVVVDDGARGIVEMLFCTSLIALVGAADQPQSSPRKLQIVNTKVCVAPCLCLISY